MMKVQRANPSRHPQQAARPPRLAQRWPHRRAAEQQAAATAGSSLLRSCDTSWVFPAIGCLHHTATHECTHPDHPERFAHWMDHKPQRSLRYHRLLLRIVCAQEAASGCYLERIGEHEEISPTLSPAPKNSQHPGQSLSGGQWLLQRQLQRPWQKRKHRAQFQMQCVKKQSISRSNCLSLWAQQKLLRALFLCLFLLLSALLQCTP